MRHVAIGGAILFALAIIIGIVPAKADCITADTLATIVGDARNMGAPVKVVFLDADQTAAVIAAVSEAGVDGVNNRWRESTSAWFIDAGNAATVLWVLPDGGSCGYTTGPTLRGIVYGAIGGDT